ncbi:amino acid adenylation domain-containing protein [Streptomyces sp. NBC_01306]|uniref:amino acid adenylation domain-containing protein n=1 Tax=Streptomyces sp. NBC_01306 TaxID=2903819 RepID=UPI00225A9A5A|nr:amino acid adenylation domain-containing protein [Streptomyces sp. NBC_01306]MCX4725060.1 amino acid adenylation domain-containing protein [Streptomyces sp. NBC_01306]
MATHSDSALPLLRVPFDIGPDTGALLAERADKLGVGTLAPVLAAAALALGRWTGFTVLQARVSAAGAQGPGAGETLDVEINDLVNTDDFLLSLNAPAVRLPDLAGGPVCLAFAPQGGVGLRLTIDLADPALTGTAEGSGPQWSGGDLADLIDDIRCAAADLAVSSGRLEDVRCIAPARRDRLAAADRSGMRFPSVSLDALFRDVAARTPDAPAVRDEVAQLTYAQLSAAAAQQAQRLREAGVGPGDRVLIGLDRSVAEVVAVLGTVWAGATYVGVDLELPAAHLARITGRCAPAAVLAGPGAAAHPALEDVPAVETWSPLWESAPVPGVKPAASDPERLAYIAFTSGSTGEPKGVCIPHRAVIRLVQDGEVALLGSGDRMLRLAPLAFDASTLELWAALLSGAALEVYPPGIPAPSDLGDFLLERGATVAWLTAGLFRLVVEFAPDGLGGLRQLLTGGDVVPHEHVARLLAKYPGLTVTNGYGPTENTTFTTTFSLTRPQEAVGPLPIGAPVPGTSVHVLGPDGRPVPPGAVGELHTGGAGLAVGYLGDEAETARRFGYFCPGLPERLYRTGDLVRLDSCGRLLFLGRSDDQVKLRGHRVEPGEVGAAAAAHPGVQDAFVFATATATDAADRRLVAALVPMDGARVDPRRVRATLVERLPGYMVPALWAVVDRLPVTPNGKVDRAALTALAVPVG